MGSVGHLPRLRLFELAEETLNDEAKSGDPLAEHGFSLGGFAVYPALNRVVGSAGSVRLEPRIMAVLLCLARRAGSVVSRDDLFREVWGPSGATDDVLSRAISEIRKALGETSRTARMVETIPKSGYRLAVQPGPISRSAIGFDTPIAVPLPETDSSGLRLRSRPAPRDRSMAVLWRRTGAAVFAAALVGFAVFVLRPSPHPSTTGIRFDLPPSELAARDGDEVHPSVSPDGERVAYAWRAASTSFFDLMLGYVADGSLSGVLPITATAGDNELSPSWSPDGTYVAFLRAGTKPCEIVLLSVESLAETPIYTCSADHRYDRLRWSPTGDFLVLRGQSTGYSPNRLWRFDLDPISPSRPPARPPYPITSPPPQSPGDDAFVIGPEGKTIVLSRQEVEGVSDLYSLELRSGSLTRLTERRSAIFDLLWAESDWIWASTGWNPERSIWRVPVEGGESELIANTGTEAYDLAGAPGGGSLIFREIHSDVDLMKVELDLVTDPRPRTTIAGSTRADSKPALSPSGDMLAFESNRTGPYEIWISNADGTAARQITTLSGVYNGFPRWSPDGNRLVFEGRPDGQSDIYTVDKDGTALERVTEDPAQDVTPNWSPDGTTVYFASDRTGHWEVWAKRMDVGTEMRLTSSGGLAPQATADGRHVYYAKPDHPGLWRVEVLAGYDNDLGAEEQVLATLAVGDYSAWAVTDRGIVYLERDSAQQGRLRLLDPRTGMSSDLSTIPVTPLYNGGIAISHDGTYAIVAIQTLMESDLQTFRSSRPVRNGL